MVAIGTFCVQFTDVEFEADIAKVQHAFKLNTLNVSFATLLFKTAWQGEGVGQIALLDIKVGEGDDTGKPLRLIFDPHFCLLTFLWI